MKVEVVDERGLGPVVDLPVLPNEGDFIWVGGVCWRVLRREFRAAPPSPLASFRIGLRPRVRLVVEQRGW